MEGSALIVGLIVVGFFAGALAVATWIEKRGSGSPD